MWDAPSMADGAEPVPSSPEGEDEKHVPLEKRHPPLPWVIDRFHLDIDALREMLAEFVPLATEREERRVDSKALSELRSLDPERQAKLKGILDAWNEQSERGEKAEVADELGPVFREIFENDQHSLIALMVRLRKRFSGPDPIAIIHNSLLTQAISAFEVLVSGIATRFYVASRRLGNRQQGVLAGGFADLRGHRRCLRQPDSPAGLGRDVWRARRLGGLVQEIQRE